MGRGGRRRTDGLRTGSRSSSSAASTPTPRRSTSIRGRHHRRQRTARRRGDGIHLEIRMGRHVVAGRDVHPGHARTVPTARSSSSSSGTHGPARPRRPHGPGRASRRGNASLRSPLPGDGPLPSPGLLIHAVAGPSGGTPPAAELSRWLSSRSDSHVAVPQAHERPERDRAVEPLVGPPRGAPLPAVGQVRVLRGPQRRRRLRLVAALQVPDPRARRRAVPVRRARPRHPHVRSGERPVHGLVRRPRLRGRGRRHPAAGRRRVPADRRGAELRLLRGPHRPPRRRRRSRRSATSSASSPSRVRGRATCSRRSSRAWRRSRSSA